MPEQIRYQGWVAVAALLVFFTQLGVPTLWDEDEPKNAECAREMMEQGNWVVPSFNYQLRTDKPVLLYWLMMGAYGLLGVGELAARLPSALLALGTVLLTYHLGRRLFGGVVGLWAAISLASCLLFDVAARAATPDSTLIFFTTLALYLYVRLGGVSGTGPSGPGYVAIYAAMGLAVLAKGPVGVVLPTAVLGLFVLLRPQQPPSEPATATGGWAVGRALSSFAATFAPRRVFAAAWSLRPLTALATVAVVALPWYVLVGLRTDGQWLEGFLGNHNVGRFMHAMEGHKGPIFYYVIAIIIGFFPWSIFLPLSLVQLVRRLRQRGIQQAGYVFVACWAGMYIGFFSLASTKLPSYVLPCYPAVALITAAFLADWLRQPRQVHPGMLRWALVWPALVGVGLLVGLPIAARHVIPGDGWLGAVGLILVAGSIAALVLTAREQVRHAVVALGVMSVVFATTLFGVAAARISRHHTSPLLVGTARLVDRPEVSLGTFRHFDPSLVFYARQPVGQYHTAEEVGQFFRETPEGRLITRGALVEEIRDVLPEDVDVLLRRPRFLRDGEVVLLGRVDRTARGKKPSQLPLR